MLTPSAVTQIHYVVVHPVTPVDDTSLFQAYGPGLLDTAYAFGIIARLPLSVLDFGREWQEVLRSRMLGDGSSVSPLQLDAFERFLELGFPFACVCSHPETSAACDEAVARAGRRIHHVRLAKLRGTGGAVALGNDSVVRFLDNPSGADKAQYENVLGGLTYTALFDYAFAVLRDLEQLGGSAAELARQIRQDMGPAQRVPRARIRLAIPSRSHFTTDPSEAALEAIGFEFSGEGSPPGHQEAVYVDAIATAARSLTEPRSRMIEQSPSVEFCRPTDVIVAAPGVMARWYGRRSSRFPISDASPEGRDLLSLVRRVLDSLRKQSGYTANSLDPALVAEMLRAKRGLDIITHRRDETRAFALQLAVRAATDAVPVLRLPNGFHKTRESARRLAASARLTPKPNQLLKLNRFARRLSDSIASEVPSDFMEFLRRPKSRIKLVSDVPLEWARVGSVPLMLRSDCTRIPTTPGNSSFTLTLGGPEHLIRVSEFDEVLIVRSYRDTDPIRNKLETIARQFLNRTSSDLRMRVVDVASLDEFANALNSFTGAMFIFDGHASSSSTTDIAKLALAGHEVDIWPLRGRARIPPIVMLSACDTHAFDGSHATPAHALLAAGAYTVIATTLPVNADYAAMFVARLLYRVTEYLPLALSGPVGVARWSTVLPGLQRMNYVSEMVRAIDGKLGSRFREEVYLNAGWIGNTYINGWDGRRRVAAAGTDASKYVIARMSRVIEEEAERLAARGIDVRGSEADEYPMWLSAVIERIAKDVSVARPEVERVVAEWAWITDALKYTEVGNPERLLVVSDRHEASHAHVAG